MKRALETTAILLALGGNSAAAQVGHDPASSPYADFRASQFLTLTTGYLAGSAGKAGVGPTNGPMIGPRFEIAFAGPGIGFLGVTGASLERVIIDPNVGPDSRIQDTVKQSAFLLEGGLLLRLTGQKTWNSLAPYVGGSLGVILGGSVPQDSSGFVFSTKFHFGPQLGVQWRVSNRLSWRIEVRDVLWRLTYPANFFRAPENAPTEDPVLPSAAKRTEWTHHPSLMLALGYAIKL